VKPVRRRNRQIGKAVERLVAYRDGCRHEAGDPRDAADVAAMAAGVTDRLFDVMDLVNLLIESEREKAA
jgi:hypothetical protein